MNSSSITTENFGRNGSFHFLSDHKTKLCKRAFSLQSVKLYFEKFSLKSDPFDELLKKKQQKRCCKIWFLVSVLQIINYPTITVVLFSF